MRLFRPSNALVTKAASQTTQNTDNGGERSDEASSEPSQVETRPAAGRSQSHSRNECTAMHLKSTPTIADSTFDDTAMGEQGEKPAVSAKARSQSLLSLLDAHESGSAGVKRKSTLTGACSERSAFSPHAAASFPLPSDAASPPTALNLGEESDETPSSDPVSEPAKPRLSTWLWPGGRNDALIVPKRPSSGTTPTSDILESNLATSDRSKENPVIALTDAESSGSVGWLGLWKAFQPGETNRRPSRARSSLEGIDSPPVPTRVANHGPPEGPMSGWAVWSRYRRISSGAFKPKSDQVEKLAMASGAADSPMHEAQVHTSNPPGLAQHGPSGLATAMKSSETPRNAESSPRAGAGVMTAVPERVTRSSLAESIVQPSISDSFGITSTPKGLLQYFNHWVFGPRTTAVWPTSLHDAPHVRKALAIGVHGLFPTPMLQTIIGKPTGTSMRFAEMAAQAIHQFAQCHGQSVDKIETIALEGSGKIEERLEALWKILLNWSGLIRGTDLIYLACHSQGVPVGIMLASRLVQSGLCKKDVRIGVCAMAGVNMGPFLDYKSRWLGGSAGELFDFGQPKSGVSMQYQAALRDLLRSGAKVAFIGSLDDQLVPLYSSTFLPVQHPFIYRAVWVDGRLRQDFLSALVQLALKLRNLGISDHGVIGHVSAPVAGSLYGGEGHSVCCHPPPALVCLLFGCHG